MAKIDIGKIEKAYKLYKKGRSVKVCAESVQLSYCTVLRYFRILYDDSIGRRVPARKPKKICDLCKQPPTLRDRGKLSTTTKLIPGIKLKICSRCLVPSEEQDIAELRKRFYDKDIFNSAGDIMELPAASEPRR